MKIFKIVLSCFLTLSCISFTVINKDSKIDFKHDKTNNKVDVLINDKFFTSYIYPDNLEKQVLYPIFTASGQEITRGFPINPRPFERTDHPHHIGLWFNFGDVNGLDFWNNSYSIKPEDKHKYGTIKFKEIVKTDPSSGKLQTLADWVDINGNILLEELTTYIFSESNGIRYIERITELTAKQKNVVFTENKEGLIAIRVDRAFEEPSLTSQSFIDSNGNVTDTPILNNEGVNGEYRNADEITGGDVWSKRSKWVALRAVKNEEPITIVIIDNVNNPNYPAWSHARGYGLFATNNLAGKAVDENSPNVKITINYGEKITFRHLIVIGGDLSDVQINNINDRFN